MDFVQGGHGCRHHAKLTVEGCQHPRVGNHSHREIALLDGNNLLPGDTGQGSKRGLSQSTIQTALPKLLSESQCDEGIVNVLYTRQFILYVTYT